jgi:RNA polymerase sigma-70 factor (ECF subfamily)
MHDAVCGRTFPACRDARAALQSLDASARMHVLDPNSLTEHLDRLYRAAWGLCGSREDAEDLVQETCARVLARPRVVHGDDDLYYLMRVLRNTFLTSRRTAARRPATVASLEDVTTADARPTARPEQALEVQEVFETIAELPEDFRLALVAVDVLGLSYRQASRALGVREATVTTRLFRARKRVAERLVAEPAGAIAPTTSSSPETPARPVAAAARGEQRSPGGVLEGEEAR